MPGARGAASELRCRGSGVIDAAVHGHEGAVRHFLREDPRCVKETDGYGREAWLVVGGGVFGG